jgi:DNA-binding LytR/AlgR family response regulator
MKAIIVDDERLARNELKKLLEQHPEIEVVDEASNVDEGVEKIDIARPDLIFLDIQMPGKTGFDLLAELLPRTMRGKFLVYIEFWWTFGSMFVTGLAWLILSSSGWRALIYVTAAPVTLSCIISYFYLPESPRWLLTKGKVKE